MCALHGLGNGWLMAAPTRAHRCNWKLSKIAKSGDLYVLDYSTPDGDVSIKARSVALTCPSYVAASLLEDAAVCLWGAILLGICKACVRHLDSTAWQAAGS